MSLQDPTKKMSKSDAVESNIIALLDEPGVIARKVKRCVTDSGSEIVVREDKPGVSNLLNILAATTGEATTSLENEYLGQGYGRLKADVTDAVIALVKPIQARFAELRSDDQELDTMLAAGANRAREAAQNTLREVHNLLGFIPKSRLAG
jgi:tryptophanyl-tRNA synthetase